MINLQSMFYGSKEVSMVYHGSDLVWRKSKGIRFIGYTEDNRLYLICLNGSNSKILYRSGESYQIKKYLKSTERMFMDCRTLTSLIMYEWDVSHITTMRMMFAYCNKIESIEDISNWDVSRVTNMNSMFIDCWALTSLSDLSNWNVSKVTDMTSMFNHCKSIVELNLANWNLASIQTINNIFAYCEALTTLNISNWNFSNISNLSGIFTQCTSLTTIIGPVSGIKNNFSVGHSPLNHGSALVLINGLAPVTETKTLQFNSTTYETLTSEEIAIATSKGWTISYLRL